MNRPGQVTLAVLAGVVLAGAGTTAPARGSSPPVVEPHLQTPPAATIDRLAWLQGCWTEEAPGQVVEEQWMTPRDGTMLGMRRTLKDRLLIEFQVVRLAELDKSIAYRSTSAVRGWSDYDLHAIDDSRVVFQAGPAYGYLYTVGYAHDGPATLHGWEERTVNGVMSRTDYRYTRTACPGSGTPAASAPPAAVPSPGGSNPPGIGPGGAVARGTTSAGPGRVVPGETGPGVLLGDLTWVEAEKRLTPATVIVIPLGAGAKEHGPHLRLDNDWAMAEYFKTRVLGAADVVVAPTIPYNFYPAFVEYPGSTTLQIETTRALVVDVVRSLARYGPRRFYVLNTGVSTLRPLRAAAETLAGEGILLRYTDLDTAGASAVKQVAQEEGGTHADEVETSMMLFIDPAAVDMARAVKDYHPGQGPLTRNPSGSGVYSATGIFGDPTLATPDKGKVIVEAMVKDILSDIEALRRASLP